MRILICGDREYKDYQKIKNFIKECKKKYTDLLIIEGGQRGVDTLAKKAAIELHIPFKEYAADWIGLGKAAGPIRNKKMLEEGKPDVIVAFHDNIEMGKGTKNMINLAKKANIRWLIINSLSW